MKINKYYPKSFIIMHIEVTDPYISTVIEADKAVKKFNWRLSAPL